MKETTFTKTHAPAYRRAAPQRVAEAAQEVLDARLDVTKGSISRAENDPTGRFLRLQRRIIEELAGWELRGPLWEITKNS